MSFLDAILLGLVQGFSEFLPISSSGHLVLFENLLGVVPDNIIFEVFLHFSTLFAILLFFRKDIFSLKLNYFKMILIASMPAIFVGLFFADQLEVIFGSIFMVSIFLIVTGIINLISDKKLSENINGKKTNVKISAKEALIIGIFQAFAILPGISRSGSTIAGGVLQNIDRRTIFRFSFLMSVPIILGATLLQLIEVFGEGSQDIVYSTLFIGGLSAFTSGYFCLKFFDYIIKKARLNLFGYYCIVVGSFSLLMQFIR